MREQENDRRRAYEVAKTHERAFRERFYPLQVLGGREAEAITPEVLLELARLESATEAAWLAWRRPTAT